MAWDLFGDNWLTGIICMWSGLLVNIPNGWALCDGTNGTPDLRSKFVYGAAIATDPGGTGGGYSHTHRIHDDTDESSDDHDHAIDLTTGEMDEGGYDYDSIGTDHEEYGVHKHPVIGSTDHEEFLHDHHMDFYSNASGQLPPYYRMAFIMKL